MKGELQALFVAPGSRNQKVQHTLLAFGTGRLHFKNPHRPIGIRVLRNTLALEM